eukprot:CAMPEP_0118673648 /NCGR_PEP_ID=MMETSP0800-20121206/445_1 /TAXON_ID=210618 ORGANISM="Striatella unipunctata, Strain CCMP2910" /NCGR_SAMPLE_ID=MMETSP0800 /ASSEMBLY_ACC=CAM_ASM_000638 /LENGTH=200 /DNA_ID=CAMNT_0006568747 /DNA_START=247 /DNA_END=849 /DNA_ORIENTATION=-
MTLNRRNRILEQIRLMLGTGQTGNDSSSDSGVSPMKLVLSPQKISELQSMKISGESGSESRVILSPQTAMTSTLVVTQLTLPVGSEMESRRSDGIELYIVLEGIAMLMNGGDTSVVLSAGEAFIVNPWSERKVSNHGNKTLVFFRITDGGRNSAMEGYDVASAPKSYSLVMRRLLGEASSKLREAIRLPIITRRLTTRKE